MDIRNEKILNIISPLANDKIFTIIGTTYYSDDVICFDGLFNLDIHTPKQGYEYNDITGLRKKEATTECNWSKAKKYLLDLLDWRKNKQ